MKIVDMTYNKNLHINQKSLLTYNNINLNIVWTIVSF